MGYNVHTKQLLESVGFVDVHDYAVQVSPCVVRGPTPMQLLLQSRDMAWYSAIIYLPGQSSLKDLCCETNNLDLLLASVGLAWRLASHRER